MPHTHIIPLKFSSDFNASSFDTQLEKIEAHIRNVCEQLREMKEPTEEWIITWHEYGLTNASDRYLTSTQKNCFKVTNAKAYFRISETNDCEWYDRNQTNCA